MDKKKRNFLISAILILVSILFTILVKLVNVDKAGLTETNVGFAKVNNLIFETIGVNKMWYNITDVLGYIAISTVFVYIVIGFIQLVKRKSLLKVDKEILILGLFYVVVIALYVFFEKCIINYRPVLMEGLLEASYPSSHTLMTICLCGGSIMINRILTNNKLIKIINIILFIIILVTVVGRLLSGVHWFTDIMGGIFISAALLMTLYSILNLVNEEKSSN